MRCVVPGDLQESYFGKSQLMWTSDTLSTQNELNQCGVTDLVMDLASTRDDGALPGPETGCV